jgi:hypothetical protein
MRTRFLRVTSLLLIPILLAIPGSNQETLPSKEARGGGELIFARETLAVPPTAFHNHKAAVRVCGLAATLLAGAAFIAHGNPSHGWARTAFYSSVLVAAVLSGESPPEDLASDYLRHIAFMVAGLKNEIRLQILKLRVNGIRHTTEGRTDYSEHLVNGPGGVWLHSHLVPFPSGHGTLIETQRDLSGRWRPGTLLVEKSLESVWDIPGYFFAVDTVTKSRARQEAILTSASPFVNQFDQLLDQVLEGKRTLSISHAMGRGITPGTEAIWIMESMKDWDLDTGLLVDVRTGWLFLRADKDRRTITAASEAVFILRTWSKMIDRKMSERFGVRVDPIPERIDPQTLPGLVPWIESLAHCFIRNDRQDRSGANRMEITPEEVAYVVSLIRQGSPRLLPSIHGSPKHRAFLPRVALRASA